MSHHESQNESSPDQPLPGDLLAAIRRAKQRRATPEMVASLTERVLSDESDLVSPAPQSFWKRPLAWGLATAVALAIAIVVATWWTPRDHEIVDNSEETKEYPMLSEVTKVSLVDVVLPQMTDDLDRAEAELEEVSEGLQLAALRHEIETTLDEFYDRSK